MPADVDIRAADLSVISQAHEVAFAATVIYQALSPPYHQWPVFPVLQDNGLAAAAAHGARHVSIENLYMHDPVPPITEDSPVRPR
jgi:hypothetical protein